MTGPVFCFEVNGQPRILTPILQEPARVVVADCPWRFGDKLPGKKRGAEKNYPTMSTEELCSYQLPPIMDDSLLVLWRVASMQVDALRVVDAWGFNQKSEIVWLKVSKKNRKRHMGMGRLVRGEHETALLATRGKFKVFNKGIRSTFTAAVGRHSEKPEVFYDIIERLAGSGPFVELFARRQRPGWLCLGNQA